MNLQHTAPDDVVARLRRSDRRRLGRACAGLAVAVLVLALLRVVWGTYQVTVPDLVRILGGETIPGASFIVLEEKLPRAVAAVLTGAALGAAGALYRRTLLVGPEASRKERLDRAVEIMSLLAGRRLSVDWETYESEMAVSDRNLSLAHMLRSYGVLQDSAEEIVAGYVAQCAVLVTAKDLAVMGACLATGGIHPMTGERMLPYIVARRVVSVMTSSGMYDAAGQWLADVGIPAKSGVAGGVLGALPGRVGIGVFSPRLDEVGNSARGVLACRRLSEDFRLHLMDGDSLGGTAVRFVEREGDRVFVHLQGVIRFGGAEAVLDALTDLDTGAEKPGTGWDAAVYPRWQEAAADSAALAAATSGGAVHEAAAVAARDENDGPIRTVVLNLTRVDRIDDVGRRLIAEGVRRLQADGVRVEVEDPERILPLEEAGAH